MRIVGGEHRGRVLTAPKGRNTRPTSDRAREAMFNQIGHAPWAPSLDDARVIDLYAGSGALGLEAMSRGAAFCLFVENEPAARGAIRENIDMLSLFGHTRLHRRDATALGKLPPNVGGQFDIALLDPPYGKGLGERTLHQLLKGGWLSEDAIVMLEVGTEETPELPAWEQLDEKVYGAARVLFLRVA
jgi:16S rRNA (guanine966-N2)-methyltransferase